VAGVGTDSEIEFVDENIAHAGTDILAIPLVIVVAALIA
jgi:hypothetical protein